MSQAWVAGETHCARCAYDLRGLPVDGRCPECGLEVWATLRHLVDPAASKLPRLRDPVGVGNALLWLVSCMLLAAALIAGHSLLLTLGLTPQSALPGLHALLLHDMLLIASLLTFISLWSVARFHPRWADRDKRGIRRDVWLLGLSLGMVGSVTLWLWQREGEWAMQFFVTVPRDVRIERAIVQMIAAGASVIGWVGLHRILQTIGKRSRAYRSSELGRQNIRPMIAATIAIVIGNAMRTTAAILGTQPETQFIRGMDFIGTAVVWVSMLMIVIGLGYLLMNAWWIRQALHYPPPRLENLIQLPPGRAAN